MNCATTGLEPYVPTADLPWDAARVQHLYRRTGFGASPDEVATALSLRPGELCDTLLDGAVEQAPPAPPEWAQYTHEQLTAAGIEQFEAYLSDMQAFADRSLEHGVREKLALFWHNHFVTRYESHSCPSYHHQYFRLLEEHAFGDLRAFVKDITRTPAMLFFLNGFDNRRGNPNENYARELFELFTLGENNGYTQQDITEASRALTGNNGWTSYCGQVEWADWGHDGGDKTVFGQTGNYDSDGLIDLLFAQRGEEIARFICGKLYRFYVNPTEDERVVTELARTFLAADFTILPVLRQLFTSAHFYDPANVGVLVKSPLELVNLFLRQGDFGDFENRRAWGFWGMANMGQQLGEPPDVAGWPGNRSWIDANRVTLRWELIDGFAWAVHDHDEKTLPAWARSLTGESKEPEIIARGIIDFILPRGLADEAAYELAISVFKWDVPVNYYASGRWSLDWGSASWQIVVLLRHLGRLPEYQLN